MTSHIEELECGWQLAVHETATSTSDVIFAYPALTEGKAVLARQQTKGRGRHGRQWASERDDGMYLSLSLTPSRSMAEWPSLSFVAALSLFQALNQLIPDITAGLKWPNDVLVGGGKVSGILLEARQNILVLGCGVNLKNAPPIQDAHFEPTDIKAQTGHLLSPYELATSFLAAFYRNYQDWQASGFSAHYDLYKSHLLFLSQMVSVRQGESRITGMMKGITQDGHLRLEDEAGLEHAITTGDVNLMDYSDAISD